MLKVEEKIVHNIVVELTNEQLCAISTVLNIAIELENTIKHLEIVSPFTGQIFQDFDITDTIDLLRTLSYYDATGKEVKFIETEDE